MAQSISIISFVSPASRVVCVLMMWVIQAIIRCPTVRFSEALKKITQDKGGLSAV